MNRAHLSVDGVLGPQGALSGVLEGYEHRPEQLTMARAVERAFAERSYLLAEAGTGTGKTLAYLVPAALSGRRVVISTATKTLQEQIFHKDIPLLRRRVGLAFDAAYLKGRANYLCAHRFEAFEKEPLFATPTEAEWWPKLREWALTTATGDRAELELPESFATWQRLSTTSDTCLGTRCPLYDGCFVTQARRQAEASQVIVVNHHLFFADLALRSRSEEGEAGLAVLPRYDAVVFDEAHALEDVASDYFGLQVSSFRLEDLAVDAMSALPEKDGRAGMLSALSLAVRGRAEKLFSEAQRGLRLLPGDHLRLTRATLRPLETHAQALLQALGSLASLTAGDDEPELVALRRRASEIAQELDFIRQADSEDHVYWAEARHRGLFLRSAPIDVAHEMRRRLYGALDTVVFTSATLTAQGRFQFFGRRMGLDQYAAEGNRVRAVAVASPFDYPSQAALYLPTHLPEPNAPGFAQAIADELLALTEVTQGRAFALFTSLKQMEAVHRLLAHQLPYQVLLQGQAPKRALLQAFQDKPSVLFASHSFWEGVDVPGEALSLVVMDRLPFASPQDPLVAARIDQLKSRGEDPFSGYQVPQAAIALRQGFGRLIRTRQDRGIVALLDRRVTQRSYGRAFLLSLPQARRFTQQGPLRAWFEEGAR